jgi:hypothetical protein
MAHDVLLILIAAGIGLVGKIVWDWLKLRRNGNGHNGSSGAQPVAYWDNKFELLAERNEKAFESALRVLVVPMMDKTNDILRESRDDARQQLESTRQLTEAIIKLTLRDEVREQMRRSASA